MRNIVQILQNEYRDSLFLMKLSNDVSKIDGVSQAVLIMGTETNRKVLNRIGFDSADIDHATGNDLIVAITYENNDTAEILQKVNRLLTQSAAKSSSKSEYSDLDTALNHEPEIDLISISTPGSVATKLARESIERGKHVFCFSNHVPVESEIVLKDLALKKNVLMMGPDCGTSVIDGIGLGFANNIHQGPVGIVSASGSGLQEVMSLIHRSHSGVSQAIGVGGRDLANPVNGRMTKEALKRISRLKDTKVIILLAKQASNDALLQLAETLKTIDQPIITPLKQLNSVLAKVDNSRILFANSYEDCAKIAVLVSGGRWSLRESDENGNMLVAERISSLAKTRRYLRGLYSGGSLCSETAHILGDAGFNIHTNLDAPISHIGDGNYLIDLGAEEYTEGWPHPFIDTRLRSIEIEKAYVDPNVGIILVDVVLGHGCHHDPAGELVKSIKKAKDKFGDGPIVIASVCGTEEDPQNYSSQRNVLRENGIHVANSNAQAAVLVRDMLLRFAALTNQSEAEQSATDFLVSDQLKMINIGLQSFIEGPQENGASVIGVRWVADQELEPETRSILDKYL